MSGVKTLSGNQPEMIGSVPGIGALDDQMSVFFDYWVHQNKQAMLQEITSKSLFMSQLMLLRTDVQEFNVFLCKWKLIRILNDDSFISVWDWMKDELNSPCVQDKDEADLNEDE